ncbi:hypothetical protein GCM10007160_18430 [Litchfieldella qijiaojingensis]|uniref:Uncharacterized protein n=1 Tax=Litchfieldella qijiaojingensis TaxID=980347 RepID=A0ABQ2YSR2_9GAMM|nr:hypothetical protein [Halomonas qijiaojingensis]GGX91246.1 hypothetical protein GCM10007160_18430 [Halomonas qijiaojingensis]
MSTASKELLEKLHNAVGKQLLERIESGEATASEFAQAVKFLKDNGIEAVPTDDSPLGQLSSSVSKLPFTNPDEPTSH